MTKKSVRPLCIGCGEPAVVLFPIHEDNSMTTGNEIASEESEWMWTPLCEDDALRVNSLNPDGAPRGIKLPTDLEADDEDCGSEEEEEEEEESDVDP